MRRMNNNNSFKDYENVFVVLNPVAGVRSAPAVYEALDKYLAEKQVTVYETSGRENVGQIVQESIQDGAQLIVAAGGDGTISEVVNGLVGHNIPLGIIPVGTGNNLAQELHIPLNPNDACQLLVDEPQLCYLDVVKANDHYMINHLGVGISPQIMLDTSRASKNRFGLTAYLITLIKKLIGHQPYRFILTIDGQIHHVVASEILVANTAATGIRNITWGHQISPNDGQVDVCVIHLRYWKDHLKTLWYMLTRQPHQNQQLQYFTAKESIHIHVMGEAHKVDIDGDIAGYTPVDIQVKPAAVPVCVPHSFVEETK